MKKWLRGELQLEWVDLACHDRGYTVTDDDGGLQLRSGTIGGAWGNRGTMECVGSACHYRGYTVTNWRRNMFSHSNHVKTPPICPCINPENWKYKWNRFMLLPVAPTRKRAMLVDVLCLKHICKDIITLMMECSLWFGLSCSDTVKVQYSDGGYKRFKKTDFLRNIQVHCNPARLWTFIYYSLLY